MQVPQTVESRAAPGAEEARVGGEAGGGRGVAAAGRPGGERGSGA